MMGRLDRDQEQFFYKYRLDDLVPADHLVRKLYTLVDLSWLREELAPYYSHTGRPSIDPELMVRMLLVGYVFAIRSERQLCSELQVNMAYRWFCGLSIESNIPDHSLFSRAATSASAPPICCAVCSNGWLIPALRRGWWAARPSRSMPA